MCAVAVLKGTFVPSLSLRAFGQLFYADNVEIMSNKKARWIKFMNKSKNAKLLDGPTYKPLWKPHKEYQKPIYGALQSSYEDVERELKIISGKPDPDNLDVPLSAFAAELTSAKFVFAAGDGLALMRLNHLLANKPELYIDQSPVIIPIQGNNIYLLIHI